MNYFLIPEWGIQGAAFATFLSYIICYGARMIDARYYVSDSIVKNLLNTVALLLMSVLIIGSSPKLYMLWIVPAVRLIMFIELSGYNRHSKEASQELS